MQTTEQRFWSKVEWRSKTGCLEWVGAIGWTREPGRGLPYGRFYWHDRLGMAHHYAYERVHGAVPYGLEIDHVCRNPRCVNVEHLEAVTPRVNKLRAPGSVSALNVAKTHCPNGHQYDEDNTYRYARGNRECRVCHAERERVRREARGIAQRAMATDTHCANGHLWAQDNERYVKGKRVCKTCTSAATVASRRRRRARMKE